MKIFIQDFLFAFIALFPVLEPLSHACLFYIITRDITNEERKQLAFKVGIYGTIFLTLTLIIGPYLLALFGITPPDIRVAGGLVLFSIAWKMLEYDPNKEQKKEKKMSAENKNIMDQAFFPITMPLTAGAGAIATVITLGARTGKTQNIALAYSSIILAIISILICVSIGYRYSNIIFKTLGETGNKVAASIAAFVLLTVSISMILSGIHIFLERIFQ